MVLIDPAESMNLTAANALLKVLEEPPADVVFLLVSDALQNCCPRHAAAAGFSAHRASQAQALAWLNAHGEADAAVELAHAGGAPFALDDAAWRLLRRKLLSALAQPGMTAILTPLARWTAPSCRWPRQWAGCSAGCTICLD